jgi:flavin reductase (DIM6/NTAB) family NADH-FMN oxidoreductase RutF
MRGEPDAFGSAYRLLSSTVVPRPIAWTSSRSEDGADNLAPYSFFTVATVDPPTLVVSTTGTGEGLKDTARNAVSTGGFVVNVVTDDLAEAMNATSATLPPGADEFEHAGVAKAEAERVDAPLVADSPVSLECRLAETVEVGISTLLFGEVVYAHVDDDLLVDGKLDVQRLDAVGRLAGSHYASTGGRFSLERPD